MLGCRARLSLEDILQLFLSFSRISDVSIIYQDIERRLRASRHTFDFLKGRSSFRA